MRGQQRPFMAELQRANRVQAIRPDATAAATALPSTPVLPAPGAAPADQAAVLLAIDALGSKLDRFLSHDRTQIDQIQVEIADIAGRIKATKLEMAQLRHPLAQDDKFLEASEQLNAVVRSTEQATNVIISAAEEIEEIVSEVRAQLPEGYQNSRLKDLNEVTLRIFEACNFQDLTGQRITKVVQALSFIEERVEAMMGVWNRKEFETLPLPPTTDRVDEGLQLHGPAMAADTISQSDIDALFD
ncbi:protein phosphatase CheZ [Indioceanicola profundi]|uniref:protein phosphatase CheZ n=1 Tax=Indioceanicola profundi TaxID=2220096 RepID=UPI000E6AA76E|nr:protein phosphatase CheZ [Indioceanicola profundi]